MMMMMMTMLIIIIIIYRSDGRKGENFVMRGFTISALHRTLYISGERVRVRF